MHAKAIPALEHVTYEMLMLAELYRLYYREGRVGQLDQFGKNAVMESTVIHLRNLADFFEHSRIPDGEKKRATALASDIVSEDYGYPARALGLGGAVSRCNKELAHLTYERVGIPIDQKGWPWKVVLPPVFTECLSFLRAITPLAAQADAESRRRIERLKHLLPQILA